MNTNTGEGVQGGASITSLNSSPLPLLFSYYKGPEYEIKRTSVTIETDQTQRSKNNFHHFSRLSLSLQRETFPLLAALPSLALACRLTEARRSQFLLREGWGRQLPRRRSSAPT